MVPYDPIHFPIRRPGQDSSYLEIYRRFQFRLFPSFQLWTDSRQAFMQVRSIHHHMTYFGTLAAEGTKGNAPDVTSGADGYAIHRFWPRCAVSGIMRLGGEVVDLGGARGVFIHAVQGMRPNLLAARWNFANFQSSEAEGHGVSLTMMEFTTTTAYGEKVINVGSVVVGDKLVSVTAGGYLAAGVVGSSAEHLDSVIDVETD